jgi:hypothetical protein
MGSIAKREKYPTRPFVVSNLAVLDRAMACLKGLPIDAINPLEVVIREQVKARKLDQNALMWVGPLKDISEQAYVSGRRYSAEVWHEHFKKQHLPEDSEFDFEGAGIVKPGYKKWDAAPDGSVVLIGSTTQLTVKGFAIYMTKLEADGANLGVMYHANPNESTPEWLR